MLRDFRYRVLQFEEEIDMLFPENSATGESAWAPKGDYPILCEGTASEGIDLENHTDLRYQTCWTTSTS